METWTEILIEIGFFLIRLGTPITVTALIALALRKLDAHWRAEAEAENRRALSVEILPQAVIAFASERPCWEQRNCPEAKRAACPAYHHQSLPCWLVRREVEGAVPDPCYACGIFKATHGLGDAAIGGMAAD